MKHSTGMEAVGAILRDFLFSDLPRMASLSSPTRCAIFRLINWNLITRDWQPSQGYRDSRHGPERARSPIRGGPSPLLLSHEVQLP
jgi:hypothetical protein